MSKNEVVLKVAGTNKKQDIKNAVARIAPEVMEKLGVGEGDAVEIQSLKSYKRVTGAAVLPAPKDSCEKDAIRLTGPCRRNLAVSFGDMVSVRKAEVSSAENVWLAPLDMTLGVDNDFVVYIKDEVLLNRPLLEGDVHTLFLPGHPIAVRIVRTEPKGLVRMDEATTLSIQSKFDGHNFYEQDDPSNRP